jgi:ribosomal protein S18 acetylase RimI-like enzyme
MGKHVHWQARWQLGEVEGLALHDDGLRVRLIDGVGAADNAAEIEQALAPVHGLHNATAMVKRLVREGAQLLLDPHARGWRGTPSATGVMAPLLRDAQPDDYAALATWLQDRAEVIRWCGQAMPMPLAPAELERQLNEAQTRSCVWAAEAGPIGFGQYGLTHPGTAHLARLIVRPDLRRHGHGRALCAALMAAASAASGLRAMTVEIRRDHIAARNLCSSLGFQEVSGAADPPWMLMRRMMRPGR